MERSSRGGGEVSRRGRGNKGISEKGGGGGGGGRKELMKVRGRGKSREKMVERERRGESGRNRGERGSWFRDAGRGVHRGVGRSEGRGDVTKGEGRK